MTYKYKCPRCGKTITLGEYEAQECPYCTMPFSETDIIKEFDK